MFGPRVRVLERRSCVASLGPMSPGSNPAERGLDEHARRMLDFERGWWLRNGPKEREIRETFQIAVCRACRLAGFSRVAWYKQSTARDQMPLRRWPISNFATLARRILTAYPDATVVLSGGPDEREAVRALAETIDSPPG